MNRSNLFLRSVKPMIQDGSLIGMVLKKKYHSHTVPATPRHMEVEPFSIVIPDGIPPLDGREGSWINKNASCHILGPGMILMKNCISVLGQVDIVNICLHLGLGPGGFYVPSNRYGHELRQHMMCLGRHWDPATGYAKRCRSDGFVPPPLPLAFVCLAEALVKEAQAHLNELPSMSPDVCVANFYDLTARLGLHQDCDESSDGLTRGLPVVSVSIGASAEFWYGHARDENKLDKVILETGDVLIFGGKSRLIFHSVRRILPTWSSLLVRRSIRLKPGRLSLTLRQF